MCAFVVREKFTRNSISDYEHKFLGYEAIRIIFLFRKFQEILACKRLIKYVLKPVIDRIFVNDKSRIVVSVCNKKSSCFNFIVLLWKDSRKKLKWQIEPKKQ